MKKDDEAWSNFRALPGQRGFGRSGIKTSGQRNVSDGITTSITGKVDGTHALVASKPRSPAGFLQSTAPNPDAGVLRRMDALEQRVNGHDQANKSLLEQIMRLTQDFRVGLCQPRSMCK